MGTNITPEISKKSKYWISRHRYYELKHFCLQYHAWKMEYDKLGDGTLKAVSLEKQLGVSDDPNRLSEKIAIDRANLRNKMEMVRNAAFQADADLAIYILSAVTENLSYTYLKEHRHIPCCKDVYYESYRKFFWVLDQKRN